MTADLVIKYVKLKKRVLIILMNGIIKKHYLSRLVRSIRQRWSVEPRALRGEGTRGAKKLKPGVFVHLCHMHDNLCVSMTEKN